MSDSAILKPIAETPTPEAPKVEIPVEAAPEVKIPEVPKDDKFASKFAALARKEKAIQQREEELKKMRGSVDQEKTEYQKLTDLKKKARENPTAWLEEAGLTYDELTQYLLNDKKPTAESKLTRLEREIEELRKVNEERQKEIETKQFESQLTAFKNEIKDFITKNDKYELTRAFDASEIVYNVIDQHYAEHKKILSTEEAADLVEDYLLKEAEETDKKLQSLKKLKKTVSPETPPQDLKATDKPAIKTLTNELTQASSREDRFLTNDERLKEAAKLINFQS
tara:strand:+ start:2308 stop:3153 length:846 start_codon:yes stop_codon:yes gene_type:complete